MVAPLEVFCYYAREDQKMLELLKTHLASLERLGQITVWSDVNLNAGEEWQRALHRHLESADIILLLISSDFMASDYRYSRDRMRVWQSIRTSEEVGAQKRYCQGCFRCSWKDCCEWRCYREY